MAEIQRISHTHDQIMNWLIENPHLSLGECAVYFNYSQCWLSQIIHSDCFQAKLKERQNDVFVRCAQDIPEKMRGLADVVLEKLGTAVEKSVDPEFILDTFDKTMHRLGYAPNTSRAVMLQPTNIQNNFFLEKSDLTSMRQGFLPEPQAQLTVMEHELAMPTT
jgi:hypothetical protein